MMPTKERAHLSNALEFNGDVFIFDCGENTQLQIKKAKIHLSKIRKIFLSHFHGDHVLGLNGLMQTLSNTEGVTKLEIYGPKDSKYYIKNMINSTIFKPRYELKIYEIEPKENEVLTIIDKPDYKVNCVKLNHSVPCNAYSFIEKDKINLDKEKVKKFGIEKDILNLKKLSFGKDIEKDGKIIKNTEVTYIKKGIKISFVFDTRPCKEISLLVKNSDYLLMEATFIYETHKKKAEEYDHMSAFETAQIAQENNIGQLVLTHFSQRYKDEKDVEIEAKQVFENTTCAFDLMCINLVKILE